MAADTFPALLAAEQARRGGRPLVTYYDDATAERVELSVATYANWVAKTAGLLQDELGVERGATVLLDLPTHWLGPVWLGAVWAVGATATDDRAAAADAVLCAGEALARHAGGTAPVVASALLPMAGRFPEPPPAGVIDYGAVVWGQPDAFLPLDPPGPGDEAWRSADAVLTQRDLTRCPVPGARLLTDVNPCTTAGVATLLGPLAAGGGTVWVRHPDPRRWEQHAATERADARLRGAAGR